MRQSARRLTRRFPSIKAVARRAHRLRRAVRERLAIARFRLPSRHPAPSGDPTGVVVSLTSFPARIDRAWIAIESVLRQDRTPDRVVLVLSEAEFPSQQLPKQLVAQQRRGLEILWTPANHRSFLKLIPTRLAFPDATIVTVDDDVIYEPWTVSRLLDEARTLPDTVVGHRGWAIQHGPSGLSPYEDWPPASPETGSGKALLTGIGGIVYPPHLLPVDLLTDMDLAMTLCATNDDFWFWAVARASGVSSRCLGIRSFQHLRSQRHTPRLHDVNRQGEQNDAQLRRVIEYFVIDL
jgi:hypothetical protein